jgi:hypothetical protein
MTIDKKKLAALEGVEESVLEGVAAGVAAVAAVVAAVLPKETREDLLTRKRREFDAWVKENRRLGYHVDPDFTHWSGYPRVAADSPYAAELEMNRQLAAAVTNPIGAMRP